MWVMWNLILVRLEILLILTQDRCMVCAEYTIGLEIFFRCTERNSYVTWVIWNLVSVLLETEFVSLQDRCTVCAKRLGSKIILDAPDGPPR
jgi:uncharacterized protein with PIN domain